MVLLVLGMPILVLLLALALERMETRLLPVREVEMEDSDEMRSTTSHPAVPPFTRPG